MLKNENGQLAGHLPIKHSKVFADFLQDWEEAKGECISLPYNLGEGKGMELQLIICLLEI